MEGAFLDLKNRAAADLAPKAYYQSGRCLEEMARNTKAPADAAAAAARFAQVAAAYPRHSWADDALYRKAIVELEVSGDKAQAARTLDDLARRFPKGDMAARAAALRRTLPAGDLKKNPQAAAPPVQEKRQAAPKAEVAAAPTEKAPQKSALDDTAGGLLLDVRLEAQKTGAAATIRLNRGCTYFYRYIPGNEEKKQPPMFLLEFFGVRPDKKNKPVVGNARGLVRRVWIRDASTSDRHLARVEFELSREAAISLTPEKDAMLLRVTLLPGTPLQSQTRGYGMLGAAALAAAQSRQATTESGHIPVVPPAPAAPRASSPKPSPRHSRDLAEQLGLTVKTIMLDAGHGGKDPGAISNGVTEKTIVLKMVKMLGAALKKRGFNVLYTRTGNSFLKLDERTGMANRKKADLFISLHVNANTDPLVKGIETYYLDVAYTANAKRVAARENAVSEKTISDLQGILTDLLLSSKMHESKELAQLVLENMSLHAQRAGHGSRNNGTRSAPFYVLMGAKMPSILIEIGYCTNPAEAALLKNDKYLEILVNGIADGVAAYKKALGSYASR